MRNLLAFATTAMLVFAMASCSGNSKQVEEAKVNAAVISSLCDILQGDYNDVISRIDNSGNFSRDDVFGNSHVFTNKERALNYIASTNNATFFVIDSLQLRLETAAKENSDNKMLDKLNKIVKKYIDVCKHPADSPKTLIETCKSLSKSVRETLTTMGAPDTEALKTATGKAGNAIMNREIAAVESVTEENKKLAEVTRKAGEDFLAANAKKPGVQTLPDGLQYKVLKKGNGLIPNKSSVVEVVYEGRYIDGKVFDSSAKSNHGKPATFNVSSVMAGWAEALQKMQAGSEWEIYVPYELGYGEQGEGDIPPFSVLVFKLKLVSVK